jgi:hypothetical protein
MNKTLINDKKTAGFVVGVIAGIIIYRTWSTYQTLPSDFLLGAFAAWLMRTSMAFFKSVEELQNKVNE